MAPINGETPEHSANLAEQVVGVFTAALALFGEQVMRQFLSTTRGWRDYLLLASGPLGVIPITINGIRIAGPEWMKVLIGRYGTRLYTVVYLRRYRAVANQLIQHPGLGMSQP
jgi:hypothetical protein